MSYVALVKSVLVVLISCLLLLGAGCASSRTFTSLDNSDKDRTIIVCTTDSLFYRFPAYEWSVDTNGGMVGRAQEYKSLEAADKGDATIGPTVTIPAERIASFYEPGGLTTLGGVSLVFLITAGLVALLFLGAFYLGSWS